MFQGFIAAILAKVAESVIGKLFRTLFSTIPTTARAIAELKWSALNARTDRERIEAEENIKALEAKRDVLVSETRSPWNSIARAVFLAPFAFYLSWVVAWDKIICGWFRPERTCTTDPLSDWLSNIAMIIIAFYFMTDLTRVIKR